jgi:pimeloyl-ACP methyl ester carboxylesterase
MEIRPIKIEFPQEALDDLRARLRRVRWPNEIPGSGWDYGTNLDYMKKLVAYWLDEYDWRRQEGMLNQFPQYKANVDGLGIHFLKVDGRGPNPLPLIMLHGYPWSVLTLYRIIPMLTNPAAYGGDPQDAFTVIAPSLCGFCLSDPPQEQGFNIPRHAEKYHRLMTEGLEYIRYGLEGGDWGGIIAWPYGHNYPDELVGMHLNYMGIRMRDEVPPEERAPDILRGVGLQGAPIKPQGADALRFWKAAEKYWMYEGAYAHVNMTRPQSLAYALSDSPVGLLAWFVEKFRAWSDWDDNFETLFSKDHLITNAMLYWLPNTFASAIRIYYESHQHPWTVKPGVKVTVPTGLAAFPKDIVPIVKSQAEKYFNVVRFNEFPHGGHFAIHEQAPVLAHDIREFFRPLRPAH